MRVSSFIRIGAHTRAGKPHSEGVELFAFHGNVNRELGEREAGEMSMDIRKKSKEGLWTYQSQRKLKVGDVINYWLYVQRFGRGYERLGQTFYVTELARDPGKGKTHP
ncbi:hypothetical protein FOCC_FOCC004310 [Frankliniella occidentalis]|nr:hypothetical protein FOCC_FOCC004310 [Frankliniella occidentalis]